MGRSEDLTLQSDRGLVRRKLQEAIAHGGEHEIEYRILLPGGEIRWLASRGQKRRNPDERRAT